MIGYSQQECCADELGKLNVVDYVELLLFSKGKSCFDCECGTLGTSLTKLNN